jgi:enoyl-CoA hydratase/carnithine racemase
VDPLTDELRGDRPGDSAENAGLGTVAFERIELGEGRVAACLILDRPAHLNAVNWALLRRFQECLDDVRADPSVRVVLVTGRGRSFSVGGDIKDFEELQKDPEGFPAFVAAFNRALRSIRELDRPVLALVNGICVAGGLELMLACDFAWAAESARLGDLHLNYAQVGGAGAMSYLPALIGPARARELIFSGRLLSASEALEWGLVNRVVADTELLDAATELATGIARKSATTMGTAKRVINAGLGTSLAEALRFETTSALLHCLTRPDAAEGVAAFVEKREPRWPPSPRAG